jgi:soluble cytochrome b562
MIRKTNLLALVALLAFAFTAAPFVRAAEEKKKGTDSPLGKEMEDLGKAIKALRKSVKDPAKNADSLKLVETAEKAATASKDLKPAMLEKAPEGDRAKLLEGYKKAMDEVITTLGTLKKQLKDNKNEDAQETMKKLKDLEEAGHEKYNP